METPPPVPGFSRTILVLMLGSGLLSSVLPAAEGVVFPGVSWEPRKPQAVGLDRRRLDQFVARMGGDGCIIKDGYLVRSWGDITTRGDWASAAKPVLGTLLMLAAEEGSMPSVDEPVRSLGWKLNRKDSSMTFRHLINMVSGYARAEEPGRAWAYNDLGVELLARSLEKVFQRSLDDACRQRLAALQFEDGAIFGSRSGRGVEASPRDMARIAWLWLNRGRWGDRELISGKLFSDCVRPGVPADLARTAARGEDYLGIGSFGGGSDQTKHGPGTYGFGFWFNEPGPKGQRVWPAAPPDTYQANGMWNRDTVTVFPSLRMVLVVRGAKAGDFEPGRDRSRFNVNLGRLMDAVRAPKKRRRPARGRSRMARGI